MPATDFTFDDLKLILQAGAGDRSGLDGDVLDADFDDLGYDSLALLETGSRIERQYGIRLDEEALADVRTPRALIGLVNANL